MYMHNDGSVMWATVTTCVDPSMSHTHSGMVSQPSSRALPPRNAQAVTVKGPGDLILPDASTCMRGQSWEESGISGDRDQWASRRMRHGAIWRCYQYSSISADIIDEEVHAIIAHTTSMHISSHLTHAELAGGEVYRKTGTYNGSGPGDHEPFPAATGAGIRRVGVWGGQDMKLTDMPRRAATSMGQRDGGSTPR